MLGFRRRRAVAPDVHVDGVEIAEARWFSRDELRRRGARRASVHPAAGVDRALLIEHWYGAALPEPTSARPEPPVSRSAGLLDLRERRVGRARCRPGRPPSGTVWLPSLTDSTSVGGVGVLLDVDLGVADALASPAALFSRWQ